MPLCVEDGKNTLRQCDSCAKIRQWAVRETTTTPLFITADLNNITSVFKVWEFNRTARSASLVVSFCNCSFCSSVLEDRPTLGALGLATADKRSLRRAQKASQMLPHLRCPRTMHTPDPTCIFENVWLLNGSIMETRKSQYSLKCSSLLEPEMPWTPGEVPS